MTRKNFRDKLGNNIILVKGRTDFIISKDRICYNLTGNAGMTVGGTGDILAGLCTGFLAQTKDTLRSACMGAFLNGQIGDILNKRQGPGFIASDFILEITAAMKNLSSTQIKSFK